MSRKDELKGLLDGADDKERELVDHLIDEMVFIEGQMAKLKEMPFVSMHPAYPGIQKATAAAKQYKELSQSYMNAVRILLSLLRKADTSALDALTKQLEAFEP